MSTTKKSIKKVDSMIGKQFRSGYADSNALWEVKSSRGRGAYICEIVNEPFEANGKIYDGDFAGERKTFGREEIEAAIQWQEFQARQWKWHEDFYDSLALGQIVHYHDGFGQYIRCEVVTAGHPRENVDHYAVKDGEKCLKELALVGTWRADDLASRSYHVRGILESRLFKPNASCIWEYPQFNRRRGATMLADPTQLEPLTIKGQQEMFAS
jgi:hypothetical protein